MTPVRNVSIKVTVFLCGAIVMIYEIVGSRIIAPHLGTSTYTWTSLIGVILAALSLGYWIGGKWADRKPEISILASVIFLAGGMVAVTILIQDPFLAILASVSLPLELASVFAALILFAPASVLLGFVAPYAVRLTIKTVDSTGNTVGSLYALSTIGSIAGTFLAGFVLIPFVGSTRTLYLLSVILISISLLLAPFVVSQISTGLLAVLVLGIAFNEGRAVILFSQSNFRDIDTKYNRVRIFDTTKNGRPLRAMMIDPFIYQSSMYLDDGTSGANYTKYYHLASHFRPKIEKSLIIGGAGYQFPREYLARYQKSKIDVVEIDPGMTDLARKYFMLKNDDRMGVHHFDGRVFLNRSPSRVYDAAFVDAFNSLFSVPFQLTTIEAATQIERTLKIDGVVLVNMGTALEGEGSLFLDAMTRTYRKVFRNVLLFRVDPEKKPGVIQNVVLAASNGPLSTISNDSETQQLLRNEIDSTRKPADVLTDELAPVERYNSIAQTYADR
jgi:spermidine synthase